MQRALALVVALAAANSFASFAAAQEPFRILNRTGLPAMELNAVRSPRGTGSDWGRNLLSRPLGPEAR